MKKCNVWALVFICFSCSLLIYQIIKYPKAYWDPERVAEEKAQVQTRRRHDKMWKERHRGYSEETYQQWKEQEDKSRMRQLAEESYRKRYERVKVRLIIQE
ncbi:hypothetical protein LCGC14_2540470 [marine sediment metagenome]|uniref:Uncharacterized protein n=1 Tax=marine sediment metagenome TaxID=412755 RepID=A0A0F9ARA7_9ZZZZ